MDKWTYVGKEKRPSLSGNCTVDYFGRFIHVSRILPGAKNDKSAIMQDDFLCRVLREDPLYTQSTATLQMSKDTTVLHTGAYVLVDGGYYGWPTTVSPIAHAREVGGEVIWNKHHESLRKVVECAFGILKARWLILATRIERRDEHAVGEIFKVCCCLHNMILDEREQKLDSIMQAVSSFDNARTGAADAAELESFNQQMSRELQ